MSRIVRALDTNDDWTFGAGLGNYKQGQLAVIQNIRTRLRSFIGNCFFDMGAGLAWYTYLGTRGQNNLVNVQLAISTILINTEDVTGILQLSTSLDNRNFSVTYQVQTSFSVTGDAFIYSLGETV